jgi:hypothetical protein
VGAVQAGGSREAESKRLGLESAKYLAVRFVKDDSIGIH